VRVTELVGWEHSMKNELIVASDKRLPGKKAGERLKALIETLGLQELAGRFQVEGRADAARDETV